MRALRSLSLVLLAGCTPGMGGMGMGMGGTSGSSMYGMSTGAPMGGGGPPPMQAPPTDPLAFQEYPTGLWWAQSDDKGHVVVLMAWGSACRACVQELPALETIGRWYAAKGLHVYAINVEPDPSHFPAVLKTLPSYPAILTDPGGQRLAQVIGLRSIPTTWVLDQGGKLVFTQEGWDATVSDALNAKLRSLLGGEP